MLDVNARSLAKTSTSPSSRTAWDARWRSSGVEPTRSSSTDSRSSSARHKVHGLRAPPPARRRRRRRLMDAFPWRSRRVGVVFAFSAATSRVSHFLARRWASSTSRGGSSRPLSATCGGCTGRVRAHARHGQRHSAMDVLELMNRREVPRSSSRAGRTSRWDARRRRRCERRRRARTSWSCRTHARGDDRGEGRDRRGVGRVFRGEGRGG